MDEKRWKKISHIFELALTLPEERRTTYIHHLCAGDPGLEREINDLLVSVEESDQLLDDHLEKNEALLRDLVTNLEQSEAPRSLVGSTLGRWRVVDLLGRGGMGDVYKVERTDSDIHQQGALKIMRLGLDTPDNVRRFRLEKQILAGLHHPDIASLIDSGISEEGLPFLVMEYVDGIPITDYCDRQKMTIRERLTLFKPVCLAVQHAHKNLVVHRDLKPENILVTEEGRIKILDFGIAKLLDPDLYTFSTVETRQEMRLMSLEYAAPEQVSGEAITTATDIYALGILLFELLSGINPFDFEDKGFRSIARTIQRGQPPSASRKLGQLGDTERHKEIAESRSVLFADLIKQLRGDLDAILSKALRKEPEERYHSADQLRMDLVNYSKDQPVLARGESRRYRVKKFLKRHSVGLTTVAVFLLVVASLVSYYTLRLTEERNAARLEAETAEQVSSFLMSLFEASRPGKAQGDTVTARMLLARGVERAEALEQQPAVQARMFQEIGRAYRTLGHYEQAEPLVEKALELKKRIYGDRHPETARSLNQQGLLLKEQGDYVAAESLYHRALGIQRELQAERVPDVAETLNNLGVLFRLQGEYEAADGYLREALTLWRSEYGDEHPEVANTTQNLGAVLMMQGKYVQAETVLREALTMERKLLGDRHPMMATILLNLALVLKEQKRYEEAEPLYRQALEVQRKVLGEDHSQVAQTLNNLSVLLMKMDDLSAAEPLLREATEIRRQHLGTDHSEYVASLHNLAFLLQKKGDYAAADTLYRRTLAKWRDLLGPKHPNVAVTLNNLAAVRKARNRNASAARYYQQALALRRKTLGNNHPAVKRSLQRLVELYDDWNRPATAAAYRDSLDALE